MGNSLSSKIYWHVCAFAIHDIKQNKVILVRDRAGVKPLYFYNDDFKIVFSSDQYSLKYLSKKQFELNLNSVNRFFEVGYSDNNSTYLKSVNKVESGTYITFDLDSYKPKKTTYWNPSGFFNVKNQ